LYRLLDKEGAKIYELSPVTARTEKLLQDIGFPDETDKLLKEILDEAGERLVNLCNILFRGEKIKTEDAEIIDKREVRKGIMDFFLGDLLLYEKFSNSVMTSSLQTVLKETHSSG
jgi:hypothetical protein